MNHGDLTRNHIIENWVFGSAAARNGLVGATTSDIGKVGYQTDTHQYWRLTSIAPTWIPLDCPSPNAKGTPADPTGTASLTAVMMGFAQLFTPIKSGSILILISGDIRNSGASDGAWIGASYGTGGAPAYGAAVPGGSNLVCRSLQLLNNASTANLRWPFMLHGFVTGLTLGTVYWIDMTLFAITAGTVNMFNPTITVIEL